MYENGHITSVCNYTELLCMLVKLGLPFLLCSEIPTLGWLNP